MLTCPSGVRRDLPKVLPGQRSVNTLTASHLLLPDSLHHPRHVPILSGHGPPALCLHTGEMPV